MTSPQPSESKSLRSQLGKAIRDVDDLRDRPGELAALRRMKPDAPDSPTFWKLASDSFSQGELTREVNETLPRWAAFLQSLAQLSGLMCTEPNAKPSFGSGLALAGLSEPRLLRLFRARETLFDAVRAAVHQVTQRGVAVNPFDIGLLLLETRSEEADAVRRRIAHDYYRQLHRSQSETSSPQEP